MKNKQTWNKLVRDNIPKILAAKQIEYSAISLETPEYKAALIDKLLEEACEVKNASDMKEMVEELADLQEVLLAIYRVFELDQVEITEATERKRKEKGAFSERIYLEWTKE
tara:strand:+ start:262 stop:594 length:333 start_codon:yes stop_codon:yes gene_type:complete